MNRRRTYIDANLLIGAWSGRVEMVEQALTILEDPQRQIVVSDALWMEVMPKAIYQGSREELAFYECQANGQEFCCY